MYFDTTLIKVGQKVKMILFKDSIVKGATILNDNLGSKHFRMLISF